MNITINFHGDIYANFYGCPGAACNGFEDEYDDEFDEDFDEELEEAAPEDTEADTTPGVIVCSIDGLPECVPPELVTAIADAAVAAFMEHIAGASEVIPE